MTLMKNFFAKYCTKTQATISGRRKGKALQKPFYHRNINIKRRQTTHAGAPFAHNSCPLMSISSDHDTAHPRHSTLTARNNAAFFSGANISLSKSGATSYRRFCRLSNSTSKTCASRGGYRNDFRTTQKIAHDNGGRRRKAPLSHIDCNSFWCVFAHSETRFTAFCGKSPSIISSVSMRKTPIYSP